MDATVNFQVDPAQDGLVSGDALRPPLKPLWTRDFGDQMHYALVVGGRVFVLGPAQDHSVLYALDERNGATLWSRDLAGWSLTGPAYDRGRLFTVTDRGTIEAFAADTGAPAWTKQLTGNSSVSAPPTASAGVLYVGGDNAGGTLFAIKEADGAEMWSQSVMNGDRSSPAVGGSRVFVSYIGPQVYAFDATTGAPAWHYSGCCEGGGGWVPAVYAGRLYTRDSVYGNHVFDAAAGTDLGPFDATAPPAFSGAVGLFRSGATLNARRLDSGAALWSFSGDGALDTAPIAVNGTAYVGSANGNVYGIDIASGKMVWSDTLDAPVTGVDEHGEVYGGLSAGDGILLVPTSHTVAAFSGAGGGPTTPGAQSAPPVSSEPVTAQATNPMRARPSGRCIDARRAVRRATAARRRWAVRYQRHHTHHDRRKLRIARAHLLDALRKRHRACPTGR